MKLSLCRLGHLDVLYPFYVCVFRRVFAYIGLLSPVWDTHCEIGHIRNNSNFFANLITKLNLEVPKTLIVNENRPEGVIRR
jgi:hypothetical protein